MEFFEIANIVETAFIADVYKRYMWVYLLVAGLCFAILYAFKAVALFTIAKREGFAHKWMAFVPFFNTYYVGVVSEKNGIFKAKAKTVSLAAALVELAFTALYILYYVAMFRIFSGGYAAPVYNTQVFGGVTVEQVVGYEPMNSPASLNWAWWVYNNLQNFVLYWIQLAYTLLNIFILIAFFRTYMSQRYVLFSILCVFFPVTGILMFAVRNNPARSYVDYMREQQQRQYRMYQEYMRYGQGGVNRPNGRDGYDPYAQNRGNTPPEDPFGGLGANGNSGNGTGGNSGGNADPFDEFKN